MKGYRWAILKSALLCLLFHGVGGAALALTEASVTDFCADGSNAKPTACSSGTYINGSDSDGINDSAGIQKAIDTVTLSGGGSVYFPTGTYLIGTKLDGKTNLTFKGSGNASILKQPNGANQTSMLEFASGNSSRILITDLRFDRNRANNSTSQVNGIIDFTDSFDVTVARVTLENNKGNSSGSGGSGVALRFGGKNNRAVIADNTINSSGRSSTSSDPCANDNGREPSDAIYYGGYDARIRHNLIIDPTDTGIVFEAQVPPSTTDTLHPSGVSDTTVIEGNTIRILGCGQGIAVDARISTSTHGAGVVVNGNTIEGSRSSGAAIYVGNLISGSSDTSYQKECVVSNNIVRNTKAGHGIMLDKVSDVVVSGNTVTDVGTPAVGNSSQTHGIDLLNSVRITASNNIVERATGYGICVNSTVDSVVNGNVVHDNNQNQIAGTAGIAVYSVSPSTASSDITVTGNRSSGAYQAYGVSVTGLSNNVLVQGNDLRGNVAAYNNTGSGNVRRGFNLTSSTSNGSEAIDYLSVIGSLSIGTDTTPGTPITQHLSGPYTYDFASISSGQSNSIDWSLTGASQGDTVTVGWSPASAYTLPTGVIFIGFVKSSGDVGVTVLNLSGSAVDLPNGTFRVDVWKH